MDLAETVQRELGQLIARVDGLERSLDQHRSEAKEGRAETRSEISQIKTSIQEVLDVISTFRGGWRALVITGSIAGVIGGLAVKFLPFLPRV